MTSRKEARDLLKRAQRKGWIVLGYNGSGHYKLRWPKTGAVVTVPASPSCPLKAAEADLVRVSGSLRVRHQGRKGAR